MNAVDFACPSCNKLVLVRLAFLEPKTKRVYLMAECHSCRETFRFDIERIMAELYNATPIKGNGKIH